MVLVSAEQSINILKDFHFDLRLRVECSATLWSAAAQRCLHDFAISADEITDLIGPAEDPSIEDCLMMLALPAKIPGCAMLDVSLDQMMPSAQGFGASGSSMAARSN